MTITFQDPVCQYQGCANPTEAYVNVTWAMASAVPSRMEARCAEHGGSQIFRPAEPRAWGER